MKCICCTKSVWFFTCLLFDISKMKSVLVFCLLSCAITVKSVKSMDVHMTEDQKKMIAMLHGNCVKESSASEDNIQAASKGDFKDDDNLKCYMKCLLVQMGIFSEEDMSLDKEAMIEMVPEELKEVTANALTKCLPLHGENACDMAFNMNKCFYEFNPEKYLLI